MFAEYEWVKDPGFIVIVLFTIAYFSLLWGGLRQRTDDPNDPHRHNTPPE